MFIILSIVNTLNLGVSLYLCILARIGKLAVYSSEHLNITMLLALTVLIFCEILFAGYEDQGEAILIRLLATMGEWFLVIRLCNKYLLYLHLHRERSLLGKVFLLLVGTKVCSRYLMASYFLNPSWLFICFLAFLELSLACIFLFAARCMLTHMLILTIDELPQWAEDNYQEDVDIFSISIFHKRVHLIASLSLTLFAVNGTIWTLGKHFFLYIPDLEFRLDYQVVSVITRLVPHSFMLANYMWLYLRDKNHLRKDKLFIFELKEVFLANHE